MYPTTAPGRPVTDRGRHRSQLLGFRRLDRRATLPLSVLAASGGWIWISEVFALAWLGAVLCLFGLTRAVSAAVARRPKVRPEVLLAILSATLAAAYCALPGALLLSESKLAQIAGAAMFCTVSLSAAEEFAASRWVGGASLAVCVLSIAATLIGIGEARALFELLLTGCALGGFVFYAAQAAFQRRRLEGRLEQALADARQTARLAEMASAAKSAFLAMVSHEIRTPLNGMMGMAQAMKREQSVGRSDAHLDVILRSGGDLVDMLNDVLDLSKIEAGELTVADEPFDVLELVGNVMDVFAASAAEKGLWLRLEADAALAGEWRGDAIRLRQVLSNLVSNALKFTLVGGVTLRARRIGEAIEVEVRDTGPGIALADQARLFRKFEQLNSSGNPRQGGTGLGLAISRELCRLMGGDLTVRSALDSGSAFTLSVPLARSVRPAADCCAMPLQMPPALDGLSGLRVLAAEDNSINRQVLEAILSPLGVLLTQVEDGAAAVEAWENGAWDLILMDMKMPILGGAAAIREIRARELALGWERTPILAVTADVLAHQIAELEASGADGHVAKPIRIAELVSAVAAVLGDPEVIAPREAL